MEGSFAFIGFSGVALSTSAAVEEDHQQREGSASSSRSIRRMRRQNTSVLVDFRILNHGEVAAGAGASNGSNNNNNKNVAWDDDGDDVEIRMNTATAQSMTPSFVRHKREPFVVIPVPDSSYYPFSSSSNLKGLVGAGN